MPKHYSHVCSVHFQEGHPIAEWPNPVLNLGYTTEGSPKSARKVPTPRQLNIPKRTLSAASTSADRMELGTVSSPDLDHNYAKPSSQTTCECDCCKRYECMATTVATVQLVPVAVVRKAANSIEKFIDTDNKVRLNTGLPNKDSLNALYEHLAKKALSRQNAPLVWS